MSTTLPQQQTFWSATLTRECSSSESSTVYVSATEALGLSGTFYAVIDAENSYREIFKFSAKSGNTSEYSLTISSRGLVPYGADSSDNARKFRHGVGARLIITDNHNLLYALIAAFNAHEDLGSAFHGVAGIGLLSAIPSAAANANKIYFATDEIAFYFSDGTDWDAQSGGVQPKAGAATLGVTKVSTAPVDADNPIAVGDNDTRMLSNVEKTDLTDGNDSSLHYHASDRSRANHTGTQPTTTLLDTGTAGETLAAGDWVYIKSSDGKLYKATRVTTSDAMAWNTVGVISTGGASNATVSYIPLISNNVYTTTGLTDGATYYLSTGGALTATPPAPGSSSDVPFIVGYAVGTTKLVMKPQRLQRIYTDIRQITEGSSPITISIGFVIGRVEVHAMYEDSSVSYRGCVGYWDRIANSQEVTRAASANIESGYVAYATNDSASGQAWAASLGSGGTDNKTLVLTHTQIGGGAGGTMNILLKVFELL